MIVFMHYPDYQDDDADSGANIDQIGWGVFIVLCLMVVIYIGCCISKRTDRKVPKSPARRF